MDLGNLTAFIDQGSEFEGKLSVQATRFASTGASGARSRSDNTLIVGESGEIEAQIRSKTISISGTVDGDVIAAQKVVLHKTARVNGNVEAPVLQMEDGAILNGQVKMNVDSKANLKAVQGGGNQATPAGQPSGEKK